MKNLKISKGKKLRSDSGSVEILIRPPKGFSGINLKELWDYRGLLYVMIRRRIKAEFGQQYLAFVWPVFRPILMVILFSLFRNLSHAKTGVDIAYPLYVYGGLVLWFFFTEASLQTAAFIRQNAGLIQKVYFPRIIGALATVFANFVFFSITVVPLLFMMIWYGTFPGWHILLLPLVLLQVGFLIFGVGCIFATLSLASNDWDKLLGFLLYIGLFVSPVIYAPSMLSEHARIFYSFNPMVGLLMAFRSALFDGFPWPYATWLFSSVFVMVVACVGFFVFQRAEKHIVDRL